MNEKLKEIYYRDDVIIGSKQNFINIAKKSLNASTKEINEFLSKQELNQVNKKPTRHTNLKNYSASQIISDRYNVLPNRRRF